MDYKILLADNSVTVQKIITLTFADEGVDVIAVNNGDEAVNRLRRLRPSLVMADISIPGRNGYEICEFVKTHPEMGGTPVILLAPAFEPFDEERARRIGADHHLTKPFQSIRTLISIVKNLMDHKDGADSIAAPTIEPTVDEAVDEGPRATRKRYWNNSNTAELNSKKAKIDELLRQAAQPASENGVDNGTENGAIPQVNQAPGSWAPGNWGRSNALPIASPPRQVEIIEDLNMDNILELDDILPDHTSIQAMGQARRLDAFIDRAQTQPPEGALSYETQERMEIPQSVVDEIVNRVSDQLFEKLSGEIARRIAPEIAELVKSQIFPEPAPDQFAPIRDPENLLDID
ncbi:MAG TPA: response regulator [Blastocatellia bacterium]|nr:response regulator [Blastocatellia bacterium]